MSLAAPNEPLVLADGTKIDPATGKVIKEQVSRFVEVPSGREAQRTVARTKRKLADMPAPPQQMNALSVVLTYTMTGLSDDDIAIATGLTTEQVERMRTLEAYTQLHELVSKSLVDQDADNVRTLFTANAKNAASRMLQLADSENETVAIRAAADILDRAGHRPADVVEHRHAMEGGLTIRVIKQDDTQQVPTIDLTPEDE
jgi:hypothetical protein